jgi:signal peptidase
MATALSKLSPYFLFLACLGIFQLYFYLLPPNLSVFESYGTNIIVYASLVGVFVFFVKVIERSDFRDYGFRTRGESISKIAIIAVLLSLLYFVITLEPGFYFGFEKSLPASPATFGFFLFSAPLVAVSEEAVYRGYILNKLSRSTSFNLALVISAVLYGVQLTNFVELPRMNPSAIVQYLFTSTFSGAALGIVMGFYFYKSVWSLLGPVVFRIALYYETYLTPILAKSSGWEITFVFSLIAFGAVIVAVSALIREPRFLARRFLGENARPLKFRIREKDAQKKRSEKLAKEIAIAAAVLIAITVVMPTVDLSTGYRSYAIASGSMQPTLFRGDLLITERVSSPSQIRVGDIIAFNSSGLNGPITHRVIAEYATPSGVIYITKGDFNPSADPNPVPFSKVEGKAVFEIPLVGYLVLSPPLTFSILAVIVLGSLAGAADSGREERNKRRRRAVIFETR